MTEKITIGKYGAYLVDNKMKYYLVQWTSKPWIVEDGPMEMDGGVRERENGYVRDFG
jgi:hypothetical protein